MLSWALWASACPGGGQILGCVLAPLLWGLRCWIRAPGRAAASPQSCRPAPLSCSWSRSPLREPLPEHIRVAPRATQPPLHGAPSSARGTAANLLPGHATPSTQNPARDPLSCSQVSACALQPLGSLVHSPGSAGVCSCPREHVGIPALLGSCSESLQAPFRPGRLVQILLLWDRALLTGGHSPWP